MIYALGVRFETLRTSSPFNLPGSRIKVLYICGNYSAILSLLDRRFQDLEIRLAFTVFQLITILEEARHSLIIIEHDPMLYEDAQRMVEYVSEGCTMLLKRPQSYFTHLGNDILSWRI